MLQASTSFVRFVYSFLSAFWSFCGGFGLVSQIQDPAQKIEKMMLARPGELDRHSATLGFAPNGHCSGEQRPPSWPSGLYHCWVTISKEILLKVFKATSARSPVAWRTRRCGHQFGFWLHPTCPDCGFAGKGQDNWNLQTTQCRVSFEVTICDLWLEMCENLVVAMRFPLRGADELLRLVGPTQDQKWDEVLR